MSSPVIAVCACSISGVTPTVNADAGFSGEALESGGGVD
jgi:hypothetical protein